MTDMTPAEVRAIREGLGVSAQWLADHLGVRTRTVQRWESGERAVPGEVVDALAMLEAQADEQVAAHVSAFDPAGMRPGIPPVLAIADGPDDCWPAGWQRMIAWRVRQRVPGLRIIE